MRISRLGWSVPAAVAICLAAGRPARAQDARPDTSAHADSATHVVKRGDTLWDLAAAYLGDAYLWPEIYRLNTDQIEDPHWIYPGEVLQLPERAQTLAQAPSPAPHGAAPTAAAPAAPAGPAAPEEQAPRRSTGPTVFTPRKLKSARFGSETEVPPARVPFGDVLRAPFFEAERGQRGAGRLIDGTDIPGIPMRQQSAAFQPYDRILMMPPAGSRGAEHERYIAYELGPLVEGVGQVVVPTALLQVVRAARDEEPAIVEVLELYGQLDGGMRVMSLDTTGAGVTATPSPVTEDAGRTATVRAVHRQTLLPSLNYYVLFDLSSSDGLKMGDEIEIFRPAKQNATDDGIKRPEVSIGTGQVVRVTEFGATARVTSQTQPAIKVGESVRLTARMP